MANRREEIKAELIESIKAEIGVDPGDIQEDTRFDSLEINSLDAFNIFGDLEDRFNVELAYEDLEKIKTMRDAIDAFEQLIDKQKD